MDIETARKVAQAGFRSVAPLGDLLPILEKELPATEFARHRDRIAELIYKVMSGTVDVAIAEHAELRDEIDRAMSVTGEYR